MFLDADKTGYVIYLQHAMRILRPGGLLLADNVLAKCPSKFEAKAGVPELAGGGAGR